MVRTMGNIFSSPSLSAVTGAAVSLFVPAAIALLIFRRSKALRSANSDKVVQKRERIVLSPEAAQAKEKFLTELTLANGDTEKHKVQVAYEDLSAFYNVDADSSSSDDGQTLLQSLEGTWRQLSMPTFPGCLGNNAAGDRQYTMGRMSFGVLKPSDMVISIQDLNNPVYLPYLAKRALSGAHVPFIDGKEVPLPEGRIKTLVKADSTKVRVYNFLVSFTIEDDRYCKRPIEGFMQNRGYTLPDPDHAHRMLVWFTGGRFWPRYRRDVRAWCTAFGVGSSASVLGEWRSWLYRASTLESICEDEEFDPSEEKHGSDPAEGSEPEGPVFAYETKKPMPGYFDILYLDDDLRITRGNRGTVVANVRDQKSKIWHNS